MITEEEVEKALEYLRDSSKEYGKWKSRVEALDYRIKTAEGIAYLEAEGTQEHRKSQARCSEEYLKLVDEFEEAVYHATTIASYRKAAELKCSVFQTEVKALGQGII
jgi:hypothetical protein